MAAPAFVASASNFNADSSTATVTIPVAAASGQKALLVLALSPAVPTADPTGWTPVVDTEATPTTSSGRLYLWGADISATADVEPGDVVSIPLSGAAKWATAVYVAEASTIDDFASDASSLSSSVSTSTTPAATASDSARVVHIHGCLSTPSGNIITWTPDVATTERVDVCSNHPSSRNGALCIADETIGAPGATTARIASPVSTTGQANTVSGNVAFTVVLSVPTVRPVADAGPDQTVGAGAAVALDGSATDGGGAGAPYTWQWTQTSGTAVTLNDDTAENPTFTAPAESATLTFELVATDVGAVASLADPVTITVLGPEDTAVPNGDVDVAGWTIVGGATASEVLADSSDATYIESPDNPVDEIFRVNLSTLNDAAPEDTVALAVRAQRVSASTAEVSVQIIEGASTVRATLPATAITNDLWNQLEVTFTPAEITGVTNWADVDAVGTVSAAT